MALIRAEQITGSVASAYTSSYIDPTFISASVSAAGFGGGTITYVTESNSLSLSEIEVADYSDSVAVTYTGGRLKFIFGTPISQSISSFSFNSTFATDRFNQVLDAYTASAAWSNGGYTLISASIYEGSTLLTSIGTGTSLSYNTITSGSHTYSLHVTASSPLDNSIVVKTTSLSGTLSKTNPGSPSISSTANVQLGSTSNQIEQGATGSIIFSASAGASNSWELTTLTTSPLTSPIYVTGSATGSTSISISATANYQSPAGTNSPTSTTSTSNSTTFTKIRSLRSGASAQTSFTAAELEMLSSWDTSLGGSIGTISKGTTTASGQSVTISWTGDKYHYIIFNSALSPLTNITAAGFSVFGAFSYTTVGNYKVYKSNVIQSGYSGTSITYLLT